MPQLNWSEYEFVEVLSVLPTVEDYQACYTFDVTAADIRLILTVRPYESVIHITLGSTALPETLFECAAFVRDKAVRQEYKGQEWLELRDCVMEPSRFSYLEMGNPFDRERFPYAQHIRIWVQPQIRIEWRRDRDTD
jgi:hypothetical protein